MDGAQRVSVPIAAQTKTGPEGPVFTSRRRSACDATQPRSERAPRVVDVPPVVVSVVVLDEPVAPLVRPRDDPVVVSEPVVLLPDVPLPMVLPVEPLPIVLPLPVELLPVVPLPVVPDAPLPVELPAAPVVLLPLEPVAPELVPVEPLPVVLLPVVPLLLIEPPVPGAGLDDVPGPVVLGVVLLVPPPPLPAEPPELPPDDPPPPACANARPAAMARAADTATIACLFMRRLL